MGLSILPFSLPFSSGYDFSLGNSSAQGTVASSTTSSTDAGSTANARRMPVPVGRPRKAAPLPLNRHQVRRSRRSQRAPPAGEAACATALPSERKARC